MKSIVVTLISLFSLQLIGQENFNLELVANVPTASSANEYGVLLIKMGYSML